MTLTLVTRGILGCLLTREMGKTLCKRLPPKSSPQFSFEIKLAILFSELLLLCVRQILKLKATILVYEEIRQKITQCPKFKNINNLHCISKKVVKLERKIISLAPHFLLAENHFLAM